MLTSATWKSVRDDGSEHDLILRAVLRSYALQGEQAVPYWEVKWENETQAPPDLLLPTLRRVEEIETEETLSSVDSAKLTRFRDAGIEVWVLVPLSSMADAHRRLRGLATRIQSYWLVGSEPRFGSPELP
jgi:hypothetical protein